MSIRLKSEVLGKGKYSLTINKPQRCLGCGVLCANLPSLRDHQMFCELAQERYEMTPVRDIDFVRGDQRAR